MAVRDEELAKLDFRVKTMLPEEYQDSYESLEPVPMRSAALKYDADGRVAWDEIWGSFCDLAMAGGPPHKGSLLEPASAADITAQPGRYTEVVEEICRGIILATQLDAREAPGPGWIRVWCYSDTMAAWLLRAIVMENVAVRSAGKYLYLPAAPYFRLEKEIKNVVTVIAKTSHYWLGHIIGAQRQAIEDLLREMEVESPLIEPVGGDWRPLGETIQGETGLQPSERRYEGWLGLRCPSVKTAVWMARGLVASNVLARREETILFVPVDAARDPEGRLVASRVARLWRLQGSATDR